MPIYSVLKNKTNSDFSKFDLFPFGGDGIELYSRGASTSFGFRGALRPTCAYGTRLAGAALLASLESELSDSASLRYLRRAHCVSRRREENLAIAATKTKGIPEFGYPFCLAGRKRVCLNLVSIDNFLVFVYNYLGMYGI